MGLDITHYKATSEKANDDDLFYIGQDIYGETGAEIRGKFDTFNVDFNHFSKYIQEIDVLTEVESITIVKGVEISQKNERLEIIEKNGGNFGNKNQL